jgi:8-oxo-dGTP pyrophosphatase MutT (NUDIX family)
VTATVVILVALLLFAALRLWITANRLDRLHVRTEAAWSALEGALSRRVVAARAVAAAGGLPPAQADELRRVADVADRSDRAHRADAENDLSRVLSLLPPPAEEHLAAELDDAAERVLLARRFYNDAVRDTRALRAVWFTRVFGLAGRAALPEYFEIAESAARADAGSPAQPVRRTAARVVLLDERHRVLLLSGTDPQVGSRWWITPGGGAENGEPLTETAIRELAEETGVRLRTDELVGPLWRRVARFHFTGVDYEQTEFYFAAALPSAAPAAASPAPASGDGPDDGWDRSGHTTDERLTLTGQRWWATEALVSTGEDVHPRELAARLPEAVTALATGAAPALVPDID